MVWPEDLQQVRKEWLRALGARELFRQKYRARRADGSIMWVRAAGRFFYDGTGRAIRFVGVFVDVTDTHAAMEALREADRRKDEFLATLAHELRNPLAPIRNAVQRAASCTGPATPEAALGARRHRPAGAAHGAAGRRPARRVAHQHAARSNCSSERVELADVVQGAVETSRPLIEPVRARARASSCRPSRCSSRRRPGAAGAGVLQPAQQRRQVHAAGGRIELGCRRCKAATSSSRVRDNGIGIPREMLPSVFEMFAQVDRSLERRRAGWASG